MQKKARFVVNAHFNYNAEHFRAYESSRACHTCIVEAISDEDARHMAKDAVLKDTPSAHNFSINAEFIDYVKGD